MTFDPRVEMMIGSSWTDITTDVLERDNLTITRAKSDPESTASPSICRFSLNNRDGKYSPRNPIGPYHGKIGRNTPVRVQVRMPTGTAGNLVPNSTFETDVSGWQAFGFGYGGGSVAQSAVQAWQGTKSALVTWPTTAGAVTSFIGTTIPLVVGRVYTLSMFVFVPAGNPDVRATLGYTVSSPYTSVKDAWTRLTLTFTTTTATATYAVGVESAAATTAGQICYIDGVMVDEGPAIFDFVTTPPPIYQRFYGETTELPPRWDISGLDAWVQCEAASLKRRVDQGSQPVNSGLKNYYLSTQPVTYWALDDGPRSIKGAPASVSKYKGSSFYEAPSSIVTTFGAGILADYLSASLRVNDTAPATGAGFMTGRCTGTQAAPTSLAWEFVYRGDTLITADGTNIGAWQMDFQVEGTALGTYDQWSVKFRRSTDNDVQLVLVLDKLGESPTTVNLTDTGPLAILTDGQLHHVRLQLTQNGANVDYTVYVDGVSALSGTRNTHTLRRCATASLFYDRIDNTFDLLAFGHLIVWEGADIPPIGVTSVAAFGFAGEKAGRRFERLCAETGTPFVSIGNLDDTQPMGVQHSDYFSNKLLEVEATDRGIYDDPRDSLALRYQTRTSLYTQAPTATLRLDALEVGAPLEPTDDDQLTRNDIFAQNRDGGSFQATKTSGPLSIQDPPYILLTNTGGVGRYKDEVQVNAETDAMLEGIANWLLSLGTVDEARYPRISVNLALPWVANHPTLPGQLLTLDAGRILAVTGGARFNIYDDIRQMVIGYAETLGTEDYDITFNTAPASPYDIAKYGSAVGSGPDRYDTAGSKLAAGVNATATSLSVADTGGTLWTTVAGEFPFDIVVGGERITVTNITGGSSPQTFSPVVRSVNGVVKAQAADTPVRLWKTPRYGLQGG